MSTNRRARRRGDSDREEPSRSEEVDDSIGRCSSWLDLTIAASELASSLVGQVGIDRRCHIARLALQTESLKRAAEPVRHDAVRLEVNLLASDGVRLDQLTLNSKQAAAPRQLSLSFAEPVGTAEVRDDRRRHIAEPARRLRAPVGIDEQRLAVADAASRRRLGFG